MAPTTTPTADAPVIRPRTRTRRREPAPLEQIPAWHELVPVMDPALTTPPVGPGMEELLRFIDDPSPANMAAVRAKLTKRVVYTSRKRAKKKPRPAAARRRSLG